MLRCAFAVLLPALLPAADELMAQNAPPAVPLSNAPPSGREPFALARVARDGDRFKMLLRQFRAVEPALHGREEAGHRDAIAEYQGARDLPAAHWVWVEPYWFLFRDGPDEQVAARSWGSEQACGAPDTPEAGDHGTAWASREQDAGTEWLLLEFGAPVRATKVEIHETFNPGALESIAILDPTGAELEVWRAGKVAAASEAARDLRLDLPLGFTVERLKLYLRSEVVPGWNEIDAVGLHDDKGKVHWAERAEASSTYADVAPAQPQRVFNVQFQQRVAQAAFHVQFAEVAFQRVQQPLDIRVRELPQVAFKPAFVQPAADAGRAALQAKVAELEAKVAALQQELDKLRAERGKH